MKFDFNYIITIHNKESLILSVLEGICKSSGENSIIYPVLDGCYDSSEAIIDNFMRENPHLKIQKIYVDDVHELLAINAALKEIQHTGNEKLNIILQDDVVLNDPLLENHLTILYNKFKNNLGIVSMRHGGDLSSYFLNKNNVIFPIKNYIESIFGHGVSGNLKDLGEGNFVFKDIAIKSPICVPSYVIRKIGIPDERYKPWDDIAYCYQALQGGYRNGVLSVEFISDKEWGTMRSKKQKQKHNDIILKNLNLFKEQNSNTLPFFFKNRKIDKRIYKIWDGSSKGASLRYGLFFKSKIMKFVSFIKILIQK